MALGAFLPSKKTPGAAEVVVAWPAPTSSKLQEDTRLADVPIDAGCSDCRRMLGSISTTYSHLVSSCTNENHSSV